jgi:hypothetical protein
MGIRPIRDKRSFAGPRASARPFWPLPACSDRGYHILQHVIGILYMWVDVIQVQARLEDDPQSEDDGG